MEVMFSLCDAVHEAVYTGLDHVKTSGAMSHCSSVRLVLINFLMQFVVMEASET